MIKWLGKGPAKLEDQGAWVRRGEEAGGGQAVSSAHGEGPSRTLSQKTLAGRSREGGRTWWSSGVVPASGPDLEPMGTRTPGRWAPPAVWGRLGSTLLKAQPKAAAQSHTQGSVQRFLAWGKRPLSNALP